MIAHKTQDNMIVVDQSVPDESLIMNDSSTAKKHCPSRVVSDEQIRGSSASPAICITGKFDNIEYKYHVDSSKILGSGHHGSVRECVDRATGEKYAVKSIRKDDPSVKPAGLAREILLLREMKHDSIIRLVDVCEDAEYVHLVTDLCQGGELFDKIVERSANDDGNACFAEDEAARIMRELLSAISYMHRHNVVHRDIKPENILFESADSEGESSVKVIDFGLSRKHHAGHEQPMSTLVGTPYYIAPEVLRKRYDRSCDLWSAGVIAYILLCGYPPFNGANNDQTHRRVLKGKYYFPAEDWENISGDAMDFIRHLLQLDPSKRMTAEQALRHPWMLQHGQARAMTSQADLAMANEEERQDEASVEVVPETPRKQLPAHRVHRSPPSPPRKVRVSMFVF